MGTKIDTVTCRRLIFCDMVAPTVDFFDVFLQPRFRSHRVFLQLRSFEKRTLSRTEIRHYRPRHTKTSTMALVLGRKYKSVLSKFFTYLHGVPYARNHEFSAEELDEVTYDDVLNYFKMRCFETTTPDYEDQNLVVLYRVETVEFWKKSISWFFNHYGLVNKTQCLRIRNFLILIRRMELRGKGQGDNSMRPIEHREFLYLLRKLKEDHARSTIIHKFGLPAMLCYQFAMICRLDDATQLPVTNLRRHEKFPTVALQSRLTWSKNAHEQRDAPWQSLLGSINTTFCVIVNMGLWLEMNLGTTPGANLSPYVFAFSHDNNIPSGGIRSKQKAGNILSRVFSDPFFGNDANLGSHSIRKFAATHCRNNGMSTDDVNTRGRWKKSGVSDRYMDPNLPYVDIRACYSLCQGGSCTYTPKPDCLTNDYICTYAAPNIATKYNRDVTVILGNAIVWATFSSHADMVPEIIRNRILQSYNLLPEKLPEGENPIERRSVCVSGDVNTFRLVEIGAPVEENEPQGVGIGFGGLQNVVTIFSAQHNDLQTNFNEFSVSTRDQLEALTASVNQLQRTVTSNFNRINRNPLRMLQAAAVANGAANAVQPQAQAQPREAAVPPLAQPLPERVDRIGQNAVAMNASLSPAPRSLHVLWAEWQFGIGGRKPARLFTRRESGVEQHKSTFSRRKAFWELMEYLIRSGLTHEGACARIYQVYGENRSISSILSRINSDRKFNTSPLMRY